MADRTNNPERLGDVLAREEQDRRLAAIGDALDALVSEHGPMLVAGAIQALAMSNPEFAVSSMRVALLASDIIRQKVAEQDGLCQCEACRAQRGQA